MTTNTTPSDSTVERPRLSQYDLLLAVMPIPLFGGFALTVATDVPTIGGMGIGSLVATVLLCYGLFIATPGQ